MSLNKDLVMQRESLRILREQEDAARSYFGSNPQTKGQIRRYAVLSTIRDLEKTHNTKLTHEDALRLINTTIPTLKDPAHVAHRKHFFDTFRHMTKEARHAAARLLKNQDETWLAQTDHTKRERIRSHIKSNYFPADINLQDVVHVATRIGEFATLV